MLAVVRKMFHDWLTPHGHDDGKPHGERREMADLLGRPEHLAAFRAKKAFFERKCSWVDRAKIINGEQ